MDSFMMQFFLEDNDDDFNKTLDLCSSDYSTNFENDGIYQQLQSVAFSLACELPEKKQDADYNDFLKVPTSRRRKRQKIMSKKFVYNNDTFEEEFIDSDIEEEQIQKFLRSRQKKKISQVIGSKDDRRSKLMELRLLDHFQDKSEDEFFHYLRITKTSYNRILNKIKDANLFLENYAGGNFPVQAEQALQMFLYYMGNPCTYKYLSDMYHVSESAIMSSFMKCVEGINRFDDKEVRWPATLSEKKSIQNNFKTIAGFPGIIGSIGGCCVEMRTKKEPPAGYKIGKLRSIMYLLGVTDPNLRFIYIQAGFPGTFCLQEAFESCSLGEMMKSSSESLFTEDSMHLIGNTEFVLHKHLLTPYPSTNTLTETQQTFNIKLKETNLCDKAFALLKNRFSSLQTQVYANLEKIPNIIKACCIIHNISLKDPNDKGFLYKDFKDIQEDYSSFKDDSDFVPSDPEPEAFAKRDAIARRIANS